MLGCLQARLKGKVAILGIGNTLRGDDGAGSLLACRLKGRVPYAVYDCGPAPENYLGSVVGGGAETVVIVDALDSGAKAGEIKAWEAGEIRAANLPSTHNSSISLLINYLQSNMGADIIILTIQPQTVAFGAKLSRQVSLALEKLEEWFFSQGAQGGQEKG